VEPDHVKVIIIITPAIDHARGRRSAEYIHLLDEDEEDRCTYHTPPRVGVTFWGQWRHRSRAVTGMGGLAPQRMPAKFEFMQERLYNEDLSWHIQSMTSAGNQYGPQGAPSPSIPTRAFPTSLNEPYEADPPGLSLASSPSVGSTSEISSGTSQGLSESRHQCAIDHSSSDAGQFRRRREERGQRSEDQKRYARMAKRMATKGTRPNRSISVD
jgi:hypothetical protein